MVYPWGVETVMEQAGKGMEFGLELGVGRLEGGNGIQDEMLCTMAKIHIGRSEH